MRKNIVIAYSKKWFLDNSKIRKLISKKNIFCIDTKKKLNMKSLNKINPSIIFFPHWGHTVPKVIVEKFNCICFHTAPLPLGRGGSPIQNQILRKYDYSTVCALKMNNDIDGGPIFLKKKISLKGSLNEILKNVSNIIYDFIIRIQKEKLVSRPQKGKITYFKRLNYNDNEINFNSKINSIYDQIRMIDHYEYPNAYKDINLYKIEFFNARLEKDSIYFNGKIRKKNKVKSCKVKR